MTVAIMYHKILHGLDPRACNEMLQDTLSRQLQMKEKLKEEIKQQLEKQTTSFDRVEKDAQALLHKALLASRKITVNMPNMTKPIKWCCVIHLSGLMQHAAIIVNNDA